ncbi:MAG: DNA repair protein RecN [Deltaproteobacteria bacterium]|nr:DNA repair protein RecN [Deltaproteobacteria bacterium]
MLCELRIRDLLLIDRLDISLERGFNAMTGETGAGKSVLVGALNLVLGGRASPEQVRPGCDDAEVEALFDISDHPDLKLRLDQAGVLSGDDLVVRRLIQASGRSRTYLNGRLVTAGELAALSSDLADIASQHESVTLTDPSTHLSYLDEFGKLGDRRAELAALVDHLKQLASQISSLQAVARSRAERDAFLRFQLAAIDEVGPQSGEMQELRAERVRLRNASKLYDAARRASERLTEGESTLCDELGKLQGDLQAASTLDDALSATAAQLETALATLSEAGRDLARYTERSHDDPSRLEEIEDRLFRLERLLRLHGPTEDELLAARERLASELGDLERVDTAIESARRQFDEHLARAADKARALSERRRKVADKLGDCIGEELAALGMGGARVVVDVAPLEGAGDELVVDGARLGREGIDRVEFLIAPNKGIPPRPLRKIASGGELSRALLALKRVLSSSGPAGLYVFDEVDQGVGGAVAERIGHALADISRHRQVLCITHLAQIAALADAQFVVEKAQDGAVATSVVRRLTGKARVREVARMLSGSKITNASLETAAEMLKARR